MTGESIATVDVDIYSFRNRTRQKLINCYNFELKNSDINLFKLRRFSKPFSSKVWSGMYQTYCAWWAEQLSETLEDLPLKPKPLNNFQKIKPRPITYQNFNKGKVAENQWLAEDSTFVVDEWRNWTSFTVNILRLDSHPLSSKKRKTIRRHLCLRFLSSLISNLLVSTYMTWPHGICTNF